MDDLTPASLQLGYFSVLPFFPKSPQPKQLDVYTNALERLNATIVFGSAMESQRDTVRVEPFPPGPNPLLTYTSFLILSSPIGETGRNRRQKARAAVHQSRRLRLIGHPTRGLRIPVHALPARRARDAPAARQGSPRSSVARDAPVAPGRCGDFISVEGGAARVCRDAGRLGEEVFGGVWAACCGSGRDDRWDYVGAGVGKVDERSP
jgi:hypothetical protein